MSEKFNRPKGTEDESKGLGNKQEGPKNSEEAKGELLDRAKDASREIKKTAEDNREAEELAAKGKKFDGVDEIDEQRDKVIKTSQEKLDEMAKNIDILLLQWVESNFDIITREDSFDGLKEAGWSEKEINDVFEYVTEKRKINIKEANKDQDLKAAKELNNSDLSGDRVDDHNKALEIANKINDDIIQALEEINVSIEDIKKIPEFEKLSPGAQLLAIKNYKQAIDDDAVKMTSEKLALIKKAKKEKYQEKYGKTKGGILSGITNIFNQGKKREAAYLELLEEKKQADFKNKEYILNACVNWVVGSDISAEVKEGKIEFNFIDKSEVDENQYVIVESLNKAANEFAKMPQHFSNISAKKSDRKKYEKAYQNLENSKKHLVATLEGKESDSEIINKLNKLNFKITNLQNNLTDEEKNELEKSNSKFLKLFKSNKAEKGYFFIGGLLARGAIKSKFKDKAAEEALDATLGAGATALASYGTLGIAAAIGAVRGWRKADKNIREDDKIIGKKEIVETESMRIRKEKLEALKNANEENEDQAKIEFAEANKNFLKEQMKNKTEANFIFADKSHLKIKLLIEKINSLNSKKRKSKKENQKLEELRESLKSRLKYTKNKIDDGLIALGSGANRLVNSANLFNSITEAEMVLENMDYQDLDSLPKKATDIIPLKFINEEGKINIKNWLNEANSEDLAIYRQTKIKNYLDFKNKKVTKVRTNYKAEKAVTGAIMGAAFAYGGMKAFDALAETEIGQSIGEKLANSLNWGVDQGKEAIVYLQGLFDGPENLENHVPLLDEIDNIDDVLITDSEAVDDVNIVDEVPETESEVIEGEQKETLQSLSRVISNKDLKSGETDSVWRSARILFMENAKDLGYEDDINDDISLKNWAENQVANAINRTGDIKNLVHEGNIISLVENQDGKIIIEIEQGSGEFEASYMSKTEVDPITRASEEPVSKLEPRKPTSINLPDNLEEIAQNADQEIAEEALEMSEQNEDSGLTEEITQTADQEATKEAEGAPKPLSSENLNEIIEEIEATMSKITIQSALESIAEKTNPIPQDKVLLEFLDQNKNVNPDSSLRELISKNIGLALQMKEPDSSILLQFYDLRHAVSPEAQVNSLHELLNTSLKDSLNEEQLGLFSKLKDLDSFSVSSNSNPSAREIIFKLGDNSQSFDLSQRGLNELSQTIESLITNYNEVVPEVVNPEEIIPSAENNNFTENVNTQEYINEEGQTSSETIRDSSVRINNPEFLRETREMSDSFIEALTEKAEKIPDGFFDNPNKSFRVKGLGKTTFAEQFKNVTDYNFADLEPYDQERIIFQFKSSLSSSSSAIRNHGLNAVLNLIRSKYNF